MELNVKRFIIIYLQGQFYELNLSAFNEIFGFPPSLDVTIRKVSRQFDSNASDSGGLQL